MHTKKLSILAVDDEPDVQTLYETHIFREAIRANTLDFHYARTGEDALTLLTAHPTIQIVLADINMPGMDGLTLLAHIHAQSLIDQPFQFVKVIMVTAYGDLPNIKKALNAGAFDFLMKPIDKDDVAATLAKARTELEKLREWHDRYHAEQQRRLVAERKLSELQPLLSASFFPGGMTYDRTPRVHDFSGR